MRRVVRRRAPERRDISARTAETGSPCWFAAIDAASRGCVPDRMSLAAWSAALEMVDVGMVGILAACPRFHRSVERLFNARRGLPERRVEARG